MQAAVEEDSGDDKEQEAAGQPDAQRQLLFGSAGGRRVALQRVEDPALVAGGVGGLAGDTEDVGGQRGQVLHHEGRAAGGHPLLLLEALPRVAGRRAPPVGVVHDAVKAVGAAGQLGPDHHRRVPGDVLDGNAHC